MARINVTKTFLPPKDQYQQYIDKIWSSSYLTNQGPLLNEFETSVKNITGINYFHFVTNGTLALQLAIRSLGVSEGEIITTPFSYVATTSAILWENFTPIYVDIRPDTLTIDASKIEAAITKDTKAILAVHVYGFLCDIEEIERIAKKHNIKVIYDAAHSFGTVYDGKSVFSYGDVSICSFHATKIFHTIEGGGVFTNSVKLSDQVELLKKFGHVGDDHIQLGINAKASEFQAAMGLANLPFVDEGIRKRKQLTEEYKAQLDGVLEFPDSPVSYTRNYAYLPAIFDSEEKMVKTLELLNKNDIFPRRYFFPSLNELPYLPVKQSTPISEDVSRRVVCLPLYADLDSGEVKMISSLIIEGLNS